MRKIFRYELRRAICNKFFVGILAVCLYFGWQILYSDVIRGIAHTAPFSPWSFGYYLAQVLPLLTVALLFFLWGIFANEARRVGILTAATPADQGTYLMVKCGACVTAWLLLAFCSIGLGIGFLIYLFGSSVSVGAFFFPTLLTMLPSLIFALGLGMAAEHAQPVLLFILMPVLLALNLLPLPASWGLFGTEFFSQYPLTLGIQDPAFSVPTIVVISKIIFSAIGMALMAMTIHMEKKRS